MHATRARGVFLEHARAERAKDEVWGVGVLEEHEDAGDMRRQWNVRFREVCVQVVEDWRRG